MKAIETKAILTGFRAKADGSLGFSGTTPELTNAEKAAFMDLQNVPLDCLFNPLDIPDAPKLKVNKDVKQKSQSTRLYNVLFVLWKQEGEEGDFEDFYRRHMETFINLVKDNLNEVA